MPNPEDPTVKALLDALAVSPENVPLRVHLARTLLGLGRHEEAEAELREALRRAPEREDLRLELAELFRQRGKTAEALVIVEEAIRTSAAPAAARILHARILLSEGKEARAAREYRRAVEEDPDLADAGLEARLGVAGEREEPEFVTEDGRVREPRDGAGPEPSEPAVDVERSPITFADVGGMESVKEQVRMKIIHPVTHAEIFRAYGKKAGGGILLYGPPGCGKTHLARATAGEVKAGFVHVGIHDVLSMWIGESERQLHGIFETARRNAPCVLFFDEVDALGAKRGDMRTSAGRHLINQFLEELDGMRSANDGVLVLAATNAPWHLDPAFLRPGRFDEVVFVPPPDEPARQAILGILLAEKPVKDVDLRDVAKRTATFSGADLKAVVDRAVEDRLSAALKSGAIEPLVTKDLVRAAKGVKPSSKDWFASARNYAVYANESGLYDDILRYLRLEK